VNRRAALVTTLALHPLVGCSYSQFFDFAWDEEVQLHDGRTIVVHLNYKFQRLSQGLTPYAGRSIPRESELTFDAGGTSGVVTQHFRGYFPMFLDQSQGAWYGVLYGSDYRHSRTLPGGDWGDMEGPYGQWAIKIIDGLWRTISMLDPPDLFQTPNVMMLYGGASELSRFDSSRVTLIDKARWLRKHELGYSHERLTRPRQSNRVRPTPPSTDETGAFK
jgi:hypothetical protein